MFDFDEIFTNKARIYLVFCDYFKICLNLNYLSSKVLSLLCVFLHSNLQILDYKIRLKLQCKTTFNSAFVGKNLIKIKQELALKLCFEKMWFYMKYIP